MIDSNQQPHIKARKSADIYISPIWILPLLALIITIWLVVRVVMESKIPISIAMPSAEGIVVGKTQLKFRGINSGVVSSIEVTEDLSGVIVQVEVIPSLEPYLTSETEFWVVSPQISLAGVSGLETVLSGDYIAIEPSMKGDSTRHFTALKRPPPIGEDDPGLRITLQADKLASVSEGSQLYYRQIPIGVVRYFQLSEDSKSVKINALIDKQYAHLVNQSTVFWNSGGIRLKGSLSGFEVQTESLSSLLAGGISLFTPDMDALAIDNKISFDLHEDYDAAGVGVPVEIHFPSGYDLKSGITKIKVHGIKVGHLDSIRVATDLKKGVIASVTIDPGAEGMLNEDTEFWLVKPNLSLSNLSNLDTLFSGNYITLKVGVSKQSARVFIALDGPPPPDFSEPGLHLYLKAESMGSTSIGTAILYKGVEVGRVADILIGDLTEGVGFHMHIRPEFDDLINKSTRFWNVSGIDISAGLGGIKVRTESILTIFKGGIAFETPNREATSVENGHEFYLLESQDGSASKITFYLRLPSAELLEPGFTKLKYKGFEAGQLRKVIYDNSNDEVIAEFGLDPRFKDILKENSVFWLVRPKIKAAEVSGLDTLLSGVYFEVQPGDGEHQNDFKLSSSAPALDWKTPGLHLLLNAKTAGSLQPGSGVYFKELLVGSIESVTLNSSASGVVVQIHIQPEYSDKVLSHSQFFNVSGISIKASSSGISVDTASLDSLLSGGIAFTTDGSIDSTLTVENGEKFTLFDSREMAEQSGFNIVLDLFDSTPVKEGSSITYKGIKIGEVIKSRLNLDNNSVELTASIQNDLRELVRTGSIFWLAKTEFGLLRQTNLDNLLSGPELRLIPADGDLKNRFTIQTHTPVIKARFSGLNLVLETSHLGSVTTGAPVYYRQITVGEVLGYELSSHADMVHIYINIEERYQALVRENSRFWNTSGLVIEAGLFSGVNIKSESLESLIAGGIAFATPDNPADKVVSQHHFKLADEAHSNWQDWRPQIQLD